MAKIFVSHSAKEETIKNFFLQAFAGTNVKPIFEELEQEIPSGINASKIQNDIRTSNAVFVLLSPSVSDTKHTRDWVIWERATSTTLNKELWVFEPFDTAASAGMVVPQLDHFVVYEQDNDYRKLSRTIIGLYDDSHILPVLAGSGAGGALLSENDRG